MTTYTVTAAADDGYWKFNGLPHKINASLGDHVEFMEPGWSHKDLVDEVCKVNKGVKPGDVFDTPSGKFEFMPPLVVPYFDPQPQPQPQQTGCACNGGGQCSGQCANGGCQGGCGGQCGGAAHAPTQAAAPQGANPVQKVNAMVKFTAFDGGQMLGGQFPVLMPATSMELAAEFDKVSNACEPSDIVSTITSPGWPNAGPRVIELLYTSVNRRVVVVFE